MVDPTKIAQTTISNDISPDGVPLQQSAAPTSGDKPSVTTVPESTPVEETPAEAESNVEEVDFNSFLNVKETPHKKEEPVKKEAEVTEVKTVEKKETNPAAFKTTIRSDGKLVPARNYDGIDEADRVLFEKMNNAAFDRMKALYIADKTRLLELEETKKAVAERDAKLSDLSKGIVKIPDNYYEHPEGYKLTPEFVQAENKVNVSSFILNHWTEQLQNLRGGAADYVYLGINNDGQLYQQTIKADEKTEVGLMGAITHAQNQLATSQAELGLISKTFKSKHSEQVSWLKEFEAKTFSAFDKPENKELAKVVDNVVKTLPPTFHNNPLASFAAKALVMCNQLGMLLKQQKEGQAAGVQQPTKGKSADAKKAGPTSSDTVSGSNGANGDTEVTFDQFERVKSGF